MANIKIELTKNNDQKYAINRFNGLTSIESLSQSTSSPEDINYGVNANSGSVNIIDVNNEISDLVKNGEISSSNVPVDVYIDNNKIQQHLSNDSNYNNSNKTFSIDLSNKAKDLDILRYSGFPYPDGSRTAYDVLFDIMADLNGFKYKGNHNLPDEYTEVDSITSNGNEYIDLGVEIKNNIRIKTKLKFNSTATDAVVFGANVYSNPSVWLSNSGTSFKLQYSGQDFTGGTIDTTKFYDIESVISYQDQHLIVDGNRILSGDVGIEIHGGPNLYMFAYNNYDVADSFSRVTIEGVTKVYSNDALVRELVPCYRKSDSVVGLYDLVNKTFYISGSGSLTKGSDIFNFDFMLSNDENKDYDIKKQLRDITIEYPYIESNITYRDAINKVCEIAQINLYTNDDGDYKFITARPIFYDTEDKIHIKRNNMYSILDTSLFVRNKFDGVEVKESEVLDTIEYGSNIYTQTADSSAVTQSLTIDDLNNGIDEDIQSTVTVGALTAAYVKIKGYYIDGSFDIPKSLNGNTNDILKVYDSPFTDDGNPRFTVKCKKVEKIATGTMQAAIQQRRINSISYSAFTDADFEGVETNPYYEITENAIATFGIYSSNAKVKLDDKSTLEVTDNGSVYHVEYHILCGYDKLYLKHTQASEYTSINVDGKITRYKPVSVEISCYGDKRVIEFPLQDASTENIENAKTKVSLNDNELMQTRTRYKGTKISTVIKNNILNDYSNGISTAKITVDCADYFNDENIKVVDWENREILRVGQIVYFDNDIYSDDTQRYWEITGRTFIYEGVPLVDLELRECIITEKLPDSGLYQNGVLVKTWNEIVEEYPDAFTVENTISANGSTSYFTDLTGDLIIDNTIINIGDSAFRNCTGLTSISIPIGVTNIGSYAFRGCTGLTTITIPENVTSIGSYAFYKCTGLVGTLNIPNNVTVIESGTFHSCSGLTNIILPNNLTRIKTFAFNGCSSLVNIIFPESITNIEYNSFEECTSLTRVIIPSSVTNLGSSSFSNCTGLTEFYLYNTISDTKIRDIFNAWFYGCNPALILHIPEDVTNPTGSYGPYWNYYSSTGTLTYIADL